MFGGVPSFIYVSQEGPWNQAQFTCQSLGGDLAKIDTVEMYQLILETSWNKYSSEVM